MQDSYSEIFISESQEYLGSISKCLVKLERNPADLESLNEIFRCVHTLKGMSATMGFDKLAQLSHQMENLLDALRSQRRKVTPEIIDMLFFCTDTIEKLVEDIKLKRESRIGILGLLEDLKKFLPVPGPEKEEKIFEPQLESTEFSDKEMKIFKGAKDKGLNLFKVKVSLAEDCVMKEARAFMVMMSLKGIGQNIKSFPSIEDLKEGRFDLSFTVILAAKESKEIIREELLNIADVEEVMVTTLDLSLGRAVSVEPTAPSYIKKIQSMRIPVERLDKIMNLMGELTIAKIRLMQTVRTYKNEILEEIASGVERLTSTLQDEIMQTRLLPIAYILDAFPRAVRDLSRRQNKEIDLEIVGSEIELDRVVLDEIGDPLVHLVRNAIDHGIEAPEERKALKKNPRGKITINISRQKGQIFIEVADDGKGVDIPAVRRVALEKGLISETEAVNLDERKALYLLALSGFSTSKKITEVSGRGVGLDIVKSKMDALGGRLDFETKAGVGSRFILTLPLTLAIIKAMLVKVGEEIFAIPLMSIRETIKLNESEIKIIQNFEVVRVRDEVIPIIRLDKELGISDSLQSDKKDLDGRISLVIVEYGQKSLGLAISQVIGEQDIVVKPLGSLVRRTKGIAAATILGDGRVALILDIMSLR